MSILNNVFFSQRFNTNEITSATISNVWDIFQEAFEPLGATFKRDVENTVMYIYLSGFDKTGVFLIVGLNSANEGKGVNLSYYLNEEKSTISHNVGSQTTTFLSFLRTAYGISWGVNSSLADSAIYSNFQGIFTKDSTPTLIVSDHTFGNSTNNNVAIMSLLHNSIEYFPSENAFLQPSLSDQNFAMTNAYSGVVNLNLMHLFRVLGKPKKFDEGNTGRIVANGKKYFWLYRYALEFEEE